MQIKAVLGYTLAALALPLALVTFIGMNFFAHKLVDITGLTVSPRYTGGEILKTIDHGSYKTIIHRPVFAALIGEASEGFIQIDWQPSENLPPILAEDIDYNNDRAIDFSLTYDNAANTAQLSAYNPNVVSVDGSYILKQRRAVRIRLLNK